jgi:hypothetical protein
MRTSRHARSPERVAGKMCPYAVPSCSQKREQPCRHVTAQSGTVIGDASQKDVVFRRVERLDGQHRRSQPTALASQRLQRTDPPRMVRVVELHLNRYGSCERSSGDRASSLGSVDDRNLLEAENTSLIGARRWRDSLRNSGNAVVQIEEFAWPPANCLLNGSVYTNRTEIIADVSLEDPTGWRERQPPCRVQTGKSR